MNDLTEKEQLDELRAWWAENRWMVIGGVALGIAIIAGIRMRGSHEAELALKASSQYEALLEEVAAERTDPARTIADTLFDEYQDTVYADQARLAMARLYMDRGRDADAADVLRPLATGRGDEPMQLVARLRLARILLYQEKPAEVLEFLKVPKDSAFAARYNEVIGDAHFALGDFDKAAESYNAVLADDRGQQTVDVALVRMKLGDLPGGDDSDTISLPATAAAPEQADAEPQAEAQE
ncbi:MAG: tetratricopeptide repeat protein [Woeseia sp.]